MDGEMMAGKVRTSRVRGTPPGVERHANARQPGANECAPAQASARRGCEGERSESRGLASLTMELDGSCRDDELPAVPGPTDAADLSPEIGGSAGSFPLVRGSAGHIIFAKPAVQRGLAGRR